MLTPEMIELSHPIAIIIAPIVSVLCHWAKLELNKRYHIN